MSRNHTVERRRENRNDLADQCCRIKDRHFRSALKNQQQNPVRKQDQICEQIGTGKCEHGADVFPKLRTFLKERSAVDAAF